MSSQFHNRLVGTIVVVALGVIFLPDILDGKKNRVQEEFAEIPLRPHSGSPQFAPAFEVVSPAESMATETTDHADAEWSEAQTASGWALQLGSFHDPGNVQRLVEQLRKAGFNAYTLPRKPVDNSITKVYVGPDVSKAEIKKLMTEVEKLTKLKGSVVPFDPLEK
ncbi:MAG: SPOR domain-containing protein [Shewanella sp.]|nr:SPOR domain-containing protein [Shewanella sp.]MCF1431919.1 SPOR domain-containing protein [Shewanella sp.]MCF1438968.1 SPOR domain-containing protein [Shewanella sp.]MCF1459126.1 SPOR domain-containing protein [Shewanella sp.]